MTPNIDEASNVERARRSNFQTTRISPVANLVELPLETWTSRSPAEILFPNISDNVPSSEPAVDLDSANRESPKPRSRSASGCDLECQEELFGHLADRSQLCIMQTLCERPKTDVEIATATGLSQSDISFSLDRLLECGCVHAQDTGHLLLYELSAPRLLQLEGIVDEMLIAALKGLRSR